MSYTMEDFRRDYVKEHLKYLTPEEIRAGLSPEQILAALSPEQILAKLPPEVKEAIRKQLQSNESPGPAE